MEWPNSHPARTTRASAKSAGSRTTGPARLPWCRTTTTTTRAWRRSTTRSTPIAVTSTRTSRSSRSWAPAACSMSAVEPAPSRRCSSTGASRSSELDPSGASLDVARTKTGRVTWLHGDATRPPPFEVDAATMTANVAQVFLTDDAWLATLSGIRGALRPEGHLVFETRVPDRKAWLEWDREHTWSRTDVPDVGVVETWCHVTASRVTWSASAGPTPSRRTARSSRPTRRCASAAASEIESSLVESGFALVEVRDAPDRPGREHVFVVRRTD